MHFFKSFALLWAAVTLTLTSPLCFASLSIQEYQKRPKLLVMIVIDQFRADYLMRFQSKFLPALGKKGQLGGFQYLMAQGAYFPFGQYEIMQSITAPGHATVLTGSYPYQAGIPLNSWYSQKRKKMVYCVEDEQSPIVHQVKKLDASPVASLSPDGMSPKNLAATTVGDELKNAGYPSRVVSVALKDRAAILMGGHRADLAIWFDSQHKQWVTSQYYVPSGDLPPWVAKLNQESLPPIGHTVEWKAEGPGTGFSDSKAEPILGYYKNNPESLGKLHFPHSAAFGTDASLASPLGIELTEVAAENALDAYQLGQNSATDLLAVSFSSHDMVGHMFGPNSREMEEMTLAEDRNISKLLNFIKSKVPHGLQDVVVVLTADHGVAPVPEWASSHQLDAGRIPEKQLAQELSEYLNSKFGPPSTDNWITNVTNFNFYIHLDEIRNRKIDLATFESEAKAFLEKKEHVAFVFTSMDYENRKLPPGIHQEQILHTYSPQRNGEIVLIPKPLYMPPGATVTHITGYSYDRTVPIVFAGMHIRPGTYASKAAVVDIGPTLSFLAGTVPPNLSEGRVLSEIFKENQKR
jgi:predicted AlkP superfamily pyrophosphatase or phosphodiesterase